MPAPHIILPWVISILVFQRRGFQPLLLVVASSHLAKWCPSTHSPSVKHSTGHFTEPLRLEKDLQDLSQPSPSTSITLQTVSLSTTIKYHP